MKKLFLIILFFNGFIYAEEGIQDTLKKSIPDTVRKERDYLKMRILIGIGLKYYFSKKRRNYENTTKYSKL